MQRNIIQITLFVLSAMLVVNCTCRQKPLSTNDIAQSDSELEKRGEYLVTLMGCNDCHSPKHTGPNGPGLIPELILSGYPADRPLGFINQQVLQQGWLLFTPDLTAAVGPWGVSFAANITSDPTGIGNWTEENFIRAMKQGKFKGLEISRTLLPPMPRENYIHMTNDDVRAIFTYLKSTRPVRNVVPAAIPMEDIR